MSENTSKPARKFNIELLLGLSATFLSLAALIVSIFQTKIAREQQHASVWPYLQIASSNRVGNYRFGIENNGVGPAIVKKVEWQHKTKTYESSREFIWEQIGRDKKGIGFGAIAPESVLKPGDNFELIGIYQNDSLARQLMHKVESDFFNLRVIYSDIYGNCWQLDQGKTRQLTDCSK
ncbi:hypothetical protein [Dyadobacter sp. NIV53]|uniref:hypothetical protein n=1 Tax=Dyadobacter sp. NIV53 TaxID=2861765 RepID=UPI001C87DE38|nr:hypothetical protein [Dyadobacter sp. NIV53]